MTAEEISEMSAHGLRLRSCNAALSKSKMNWPGVSCALLLTFFVPACSFKNCSKSFDTFLTASKDLIFSAISFIPIAFPPGGPPLSTLDSTVSH